MEIKRGATPSGRPLRIGISACFFHADPQRAVFKGKTLQYLEQSMAHWIFSAGVLAYMIPAPAEGQPIRLDHFAQDLDGLVLEGGSDVSPETYGEKELRPEWRGDRIRDLYEIELFKAFSRENKPVLGICRGLQLINVACGGSLYQDIGTQLSTQRNHRNWDIYDQNFHFVLPEENSRLAAWVGKNHQRVNSVHHQAIKDLGQGLQIEARSEEDQVIEAIRGTGSNWVYAVQWHPEFHSSEDQSLINDAPMLEEFLEAALEQAVQRRRK